jgi:Mn2+/Fe2+ NRAMP family transporter
MGWEAGVNKTFKEAPQFMWTYTLMILLAALLILIPGAPLIFLMVLSSFVNGLLLPFVLIYALSLINNKGLMGTYINPKSYNYIAWGAVVVIICLTACLVFTMIVPSGGKAY